ncbi:helix-turn-helix domain-containing protein [Aquimarina sp. 2201CG14-23]|uniref:helix-turn-helix domain-containing protein n=1 Tax=Aquimarina mycalae TaxID=3040073 RepID=UPI002478293B|nr:AraC family transcriptional regulator [Aquimarina sp. 2201CG14-23]MDH7445657.1 AraC family transcriptional regulator [Aquimarina sp. 2201CG14-23]
MNPDIFKHIELLLGSIGFIIALFFGIFLMITKEKRVGANIFLAIYLLAFSLRIGKSLFYNYFPIDPIIRNVFLGMLLAIGPSLWFYVRGLWLSRNSVNRTIMLIQYIPLLLFVVSCWIIPNNASTASRIIFIGLLVHILLYGMFTLLWLFKHKSQSNNKSHIVYRWLLFFTLLTIALSLVQIGVFMNIVPYLSTAFLFSVVILVLSIWGLRHSFLFTIGNEKYANSSLSNENAISYLDKLTYLMEKEKLFLDPEITLTKLSKQLGITSKQLSQVINQNRNINYSQYISEYRIAEAQRLLGLPEYRNFKISAIAYESGFNSISSFNTAFKKLTNTTAVQYRQSLLKSI